MDEGERSFSEAGQNGRDLRGEFDEKWAISWRKFRPSQKSGQISLNFVGAHVVMVRKASSFLQRRGVPEVSVNVGDGADGRGELRPRKASELVEVAGVANFFQQKEAIGSLVSRDTCKETWGTFSLKRSEQSVGSEFPFEHVELFSPFPALRNFCADFEDVLLGVALATGMKGLAEKANVTGGAEKEAGCLQGAFLGI